VTIEEAHALCEERDEYGKDPESSFIEGLARGLAIIARHAPRTLYNFPHDEAFFEFGESITEAEVLELSRLGFRTSDESWARFS